VTDKLLSLDLGLTTGYAVIWYSGEIHETGNLPWESIDSVLKEWVPLILPTAAVAEAPIIFRGELGRKLESVTDAAKKHLAGRLEIIHPAAWKNSKYKRAKVPRGLTVHERDAIRLGLWYLHTRLKSN
jgi:hypothetical protein